jgi:hypothetical protein
VTDSAFVRIYRPRALIGWGGCFRILVDGKQQGDLWPNQVKLVEIPAGSHQLQLKQDFLTRSGMVTFSVEPRQEVQFACSRLLTAVGFTSLHPATPEEIMKMRNLTPPPPTPRNLTASDTDD